MEKRKKIKLVCPDCKKKYFGFKDQLLDESDKKDFSNDEEWETARNNSMCCPECWDKDEREEELAYDKATPERSIKGINRYELKTAMGLVTRCGIQHTGWCCNTCFFANFNSFTDADWQSLLYYRGDYEKEILDELPDDWQNRVKKIYKFVKSRQKKVLENEK